MTPRFRPIAKDDGRAGRFVGLAVAILVASAAWPGAAEARGGRGGHLIHRIFPGTFAAGDGKPASMEKDRACRMAWQASLTPERPSYTPYASYKKAHCARSPHRAKVA
jgi:hypothetical protein